MKIATVLQVKLTEGESANWGPETESFEAYIVVKNNDNQLIIELKSFLKVRLPDYMIPSVIVAIEKMPRKENGKIDRDALPEIKREVMDVTHGYVAPRNQMETQLSAIWAKHLKLDEVGVKDNFFELGGDSLLTLRLIADIKNQIGKDIPLSAFFRNPTIEKLVADTAGTDIGQKDSLLVPIQPRGDKIPIFLVHGSVQIQVHLDNDQPLYKFLSHFDDFGLLLRNNSIEKIASRYLTDLKKTFPIGPYIFCGYSAGGPIAIEMAQQLSKSDNSVVFLFLVEPTIQNRGFIDPPKPAQGRLYKKKSHGIHMVNTNLENPSLGLMRIFQSIKNKTIRRFPTSIYWLTYMISKTIGLSLPKRWRGPYAIRLYQKALDGYADSTYSGPVTIYQTDRYSKQVDWSKKFDGDLEIHTIKETNNHFDLIHDKAIARIWAKQLQILSNRTSNDN